MKERLRNMLQRCCKDPFRIFFPFGWFFGCWGALLWFGHAFFPQHVVYPGALHSDVMIGGFILSFVIGFLFTAIPRFTQSDFASPAEILIGSVLIIAIAIGIVVDHPTCRYSAMFLSLLNLGLFAVKRFYRRKANPHSSFIFVGVSLLAALIGLVILIAGTQISMPLRWHLLARDLFFIGMPLGLIIGVGSRLIPMILGWSEPIPPPALPDEEQASPHCAIDPFQRFLLAMFLISFPLLFIAERWAWFIRSILTIMVALKTWHIYRWPRQKHWLARSVWFSAWLLVLGMCIPALFPAWGVHGRHLLFIGGFGLLTLLIASRVTLAHSGLGLELEKRKNPYLWIATCLLLAAATRMVIVWFPESYVRHLGYAGLMWFIASLFWARRFLAWR